MVSNKSNNNNNNGVYITGSSVDSHPFNITIDAGENVGSYNLSIICDKLPEEDESLNLTLSLADDNSQVIIAHSTAVLYITDSTGTYVYKETKSLIA